MAPVVKEFSSDATQQIRLAASSIFSIRPRGTLSRIYLRCSFESDIASAVSVSDGVTQLTEMLKSASSFARLFVNAICAAFDALSAPSLGLPSFPAIEEI